jgi:hypothetical protein
MNFAAVLDELVDITRRNSRIGVKTESNVKSLSSFWFFGLNEPPNFNIWALNAEQKYRNDHARDESGTHDEEFGQPK